MLGADEGVEAAFDDVVDIAAGCRFSDCQHEGEPGCAVRAALADGRLSEERLASHRKLERESPAPRARATHVPGPSIDAVEDHPQIGQRTHGTQVRSGQMTTSTETTDWIALPEAPPIPGLRFRTWRDDRDWERMAEVMRPRVPGRRRAVGGRPLSMLRMEKTGHPGIDPARDIILAEVDGQLVADGQVKRVVREGEPMYEVSGDVHPAYRRRGIGSALHAWNVRRAHERAATLEPGRPVTLGVARRRGRGRQQPR